MYLTRYTTQDGRHIYIYICVCIYLYIHIHTYIHISICISLSLYVSPRTGAFVFNTHSAFRASGVQRRATAGWEVGGATVETVPFEISKSMTLYPSVFHACASNLGLAIYYIYIYIYVYIYIYIYAKKVFLCALRRGAASHEQICDFGVMRMWYSQVPPKPSWVAPPSWVDIYSRNDDRCRVKRAYIIIGMYSNVCVYIYIYIHTYTCNLQTATYIQYTYIHVIICLRLPRGSLQGQ